ncbi:hypothetical protein Gpo141_00006953 [Globisporangium polare]
MKFPTASPMFPPVVLSPTECGRYELLAQTLIGDTLAEYDLYNDAQQRQVSKKLWKVIKSRENITVYKDRTYDPDDNVHRGLATGIAVSDSSGDEMSSAQTPSHQQQRSHASSSASAASVSSRSSSSLPAAILDSIPAGAWNLPKLLMAGTLAGTLEEVMYGLSTPDPGLILLKAYYSQDEVVDGQVLAQIHGPSPAEPFRFLGLKWLVKGNPPGVNALVLPRDLVLLESTGMMTHPTTGERIGYFLMHSVDVPTCPELPKKSVIRAHLSTCYIFKELPGGVVDIYMKGFFELAGRIADPIAIVSAANGLLCCWKAVVCAQSKKLVWMLKHKVREENKRRLVDGGTHRQSQRQQAAPNCGMCAKSFKMYNRVACCQLCDGPMCSRCRVSVKLAFPRPGEKDIRLKSIVLCKGCITNCSKQSTLEIAQQEVLSGRFGSLYSSSSSSRPSANSTASTTRASTDTVTTNSEATVGAPSASSMDSDATTSGEFGAYYSDDGDCESQDEVRPSEDDMAAFVDTTGAVTSDWSAVPPTARQKYLDSVQGRTPEEQAMWKRMAQLHLQAEHLYQFTKKNTETLFQGNPAAAGVSSTSGVEVLMPPAAPAFNSLSPRMSID